MEHEDRKNETQGEAAVRIESEEVEQNNSTEAEWINRASEMAYDFESAAAAELELADSGPVAEAQPDHTEAAELTEMELNEVIESICMSKAEEFRMLGYEHVTGKEVWECVNDKYLKKGVPPLHQVVNDILSLKVTQFMNWMTMSIYKSNPFK